MKADFCVLDLQVARARIVLSLLAMLSIYIDPSTGGGAFQLDWPLFETLVCHLMYSAVTDVALNRQAESNLVRNISIALDLGFATAVAYLTEGRTSPALIFFVFAIVAVGFRTGFRDTLAITGCAVALYLGAIEFSIGLASTYAMRTIYLGITGYLIGFFGQQRVGFEARLRALEAESQRQAIARSLHDGYIQSLAGISLRLETCRELLTRDRAANAINELAELQNAVNREYDEVRTYIRTLAGIRGKMSENMAGTVSTPRLDVHANFAVASEVGEHILQIILEGLRNARRHANANSIMIDASQSDSGVLICVEDDGAGFPVEGSPPWAIASRVEELGGRMSINGGGVARLKVEMPAAMKY